MIVSYGISPQTHPTTVFVFNSKAERNHFLDTIPQSEPITSCGACKLIDGGYSIEMSPLSQRTSEEQAECDHCGEKIWNYSECLSCGYIVCAECKRRILPKSGGILLCSRCGNHLQSMFD